MQVFISCSPSYLVKGRIDVVSKLDLSNGCGTSNCYTDTKSHNPLLTKGSVEDSVLAWGDRRREEGRKISCSTSRKRLTGGHWVRELINFRKKEK